MDSDSVPVPKLASSTDRYKRRFDAYPSGRAAFKSILSHLDWGHGRVLLLPSYIGWSPREGSGVFDPVQELGLPYEFYRLDRRLEVDQAHLAERMQQNPRAVLLLIHYFGRSDPGYGSITAMARSLNLEVIEDEAHGMLTDLVGGLTGRAGHHAFFSLHKLLPLAQGGALVVNASSTTVATNLVPELLNYDLHLIAQTRIKHFNQLHALLLPLKNHIEFLWPELAQGEVPQTFPIRIKGAVHQRSVRDAIYDKMNQKGFGVVSLYHTLIDAIDPSEFPQSHELACSILNLPVHQDINPKSLAGMVEALAEALGAEGLEHV